MEKLLTIGFEILLCGYFLCSIVPSVDKLFDKFRFIISSKEDCELRLITEGEEQPAEFRPNKNQITRIVVKGYSPAETNELITMLRNS